jgi:hypothetical protein
MWKRAHRPRRSPHVCGRSVSRGVGSTHSVSGVTPHVGSATYAFAKHGARRAVDVFTAGASPSQVGGLGRARWRLTSRSQWQACGKGRSKDASRASRPIRGGLMDLLEPAVRLYSNALRPG